MILYYKISIYTIELGVKQHKFILILEEGIEYPRFSFQLTIPIYLRSI